MARVLGAAAMTWTCAQGHVDPPRYVKRNGGLGACKPCRAAAQLAKYRSSPEIRARESARQKERRKDPVYIARVNAKYRLYMHRTKYGLAPGDYEIMLAAQDGHCALCPATASDASGRSLHIDHDHATGRVRGLLCAHCNLALGIVETGRPAFATVAVLRYLGGVS